VVQNLTVARIAEALAVSWNTANDTVLTEGKRVLIDGPDHFEGSRSSASTSMSGATPAAVRGSSRSSAT